MSLLVRFIGGPLDGRDERVDYAGARVVVGDRPEGEYHFRGMLSRNHHVYYWDTTR